jgi:hypothetical protein
VSQEIQSAIRAQASELLSQNEVSVVIGHERSAKGHVRPAFVRRESEAERLVWDQTCHHNLMVYLGEQLAQIGRRDAQSRIAVVAKPCDVRSLNMLIHEEQVVREQVFVIGLACPGMLDGGGEMGHCTRCKERVPLFYDTLLGEPPEVSAADESWADVIEFESLAPAHRLAFWAREFDRCIRCYACRQACPGCYCFECLAEQVDPAWVGIAHGVSEKTFFHVLRAYHLAGRCVECHACDAACPMHIPLSLLNRKMAQEVQSLFDYVAGDDPELPPPLATFRKDEQLPL